MQTFNILIVSVAEQTGLSLALSETRRQVLSRHSPYISFYQLPHILTAFYTLPDKHCLSHSMCLYQVMMTLHFLNDVVSDTESTQK